MSETFTIADNEEKAVISRLRLLKSHGWGKLFVTVQNNHVMNVKTEKNETVDEIIIGKRSLKEVANVSE